ncbi:hypothetical protein [Actinoplanes sp. NPDC049118]|uniref:hypothetical protein n=1 Tax=Actinoplanes sp. NPDC049118 TaxID=3155769 RepID=UPI0034053212
MSEHATDRFWSGIEISKVIAGTLAAVTAAVIGSFLGVAGTLAGAAVASVVGSLGTEIYQRSLNRGAKRLGAIAPTFVKVPAAVGTPPVAAATKQESPSHTVPPRGNIRWRHVAAAAAALFVLAMGSLTMFELMTGRSVASTVGTTSSSTTSVGSIFGRDSKKPAVTPSPDGSQAPAVDPTPTGPAGEAPATEPTPDATTEPTADPTTGPTAGTPEQTTPADTPEQQPNQEQEQGLDRPEPAE